ncbi:Uma2 family endonuclease [Laspinema palackyanum]|uniref:Uma2 family endonuclease n=1 Tax=Laspinema palackyanum TaxID=3231601 RepID=UPI00345D3060|nr:Uma2 family endonuclease [Laspinema sp. D2c]
MIALSEFADFISPEQYLEREIKSPIKHEYIDGKVLAMAGTTDTHNTIAGNLFALIRSHLRGTGCRLYIADVKVYIEPRNCFYYPDLMVTCDPIDRETSTYKRFPKLIIEVLSPSTEAFDRGDKFNDYQTISSLEEYVLVNTKHQRVEVFRKTEEGGWLFQTYTSTTATFTLKSLNLTGSFAEVYEEVTLELDSRTRAENSR